MSSAVPAETYRYTYVRDIYNLVDPFLSKEEIITYLSSIYKDPFKV